MYSKIEGGIEFKNLLPLNKTIVYLVLNCICNILLNNSK